MTDAGVTGQTIGGIRVVTVADRHRQIGMAGQTGVLSHGPIERHDADRLRDLARGESVTMPEPVQGLDSILGDDIVVRGVAIIAGSHVLVTAAIPAVIKLSHDMTVRAGLRIVSQIRETLRITECKSAQ